MSDSASQSSQVAPPPTLPVPDDQIAQSASGSSAGANPLDALEQILKDAKAKSAASAAPSASAPAAPSTAAADEAAKQAVIAEKEKVQDVEDQAAIGVQLDELKQVVETPAYLARIEQDRLKKQQDDEKKKQADAYAIIQLGHTKI